MISRRRLLIATPLLLAGCDQAPPFRNTDLTGKSIGGNFALDDCHGHPRTLADFKGKLVVLFFGYTSCPDICPTALAKFASLMQQPDLSADRIQVIFISLDPARDTPERLCQYLHWFHPSFLGLTGNADQIAEITRNFRVTSIRKEIPGSMGYVLDHSAGAYVFGPDGRLRLYLAENASIAEISDDFRRLLAGQ
jgi:protein SCO1/2